MRPPRADAAGTPGPVHLARRHQAARLRGRCRAARLRVPGRAARGRVRGGPRRVQRDHALADGPERAPPSQPPPQLHRRHRGRHWRRAHPLGRLRPLPRARGQPGRARLVRRRVPRARPGPALVRRGLLGPCRAQGAGDQQERPRPDRWRERGPGPVRSHLRRRAVRLPARRCRPAPDHAPAGHAPARRASAHRQLRAHGIGPRVHGAVHGLDADRARRGRDPAAVRAGGGPGAATFHDPHRNVVYAEMRR